MPGPVPKPAARRQRRNRRDLVLMPGEPRTTPPSPSGLLRASVAAWERLWASPIASAFLESD